MTDTILSCFISICLIIDDFSHWGKLLLLWKKSIMMQINGYVFMHITVLGVALKIHLLSLHVSIKTNNNLHIVTCSYIVMFPCFVSMVFIKWISRFSLFITIDLYCQSINLTGSRFKSSRCEWHFNYLWFIFQLTIKQRKIEYLSPILVK